MNAPRPGDPPQAAAPVVQSLSSATVLSCVGLISAALIAYEIVLMQRMLLERWHHFGFLVISLALLGFGASGTLLALVQSSIRRRPLAWMLGFAFGLGGALIVLPRAAATLPIAVRFIPKDLWPQAGWWGLYALCALIPFLLGAAFLGTALMTAGRSVGRVYAANLMGSAVGGLGGLFVLSCFPIEFGMRPSLALASAATIGLAALAGGEARLPLRRGLAVLAALAICAAAVLTEAFWPLNASYDEHKYVAHVARLQEQGVARRVAAAADPHGYVELYESAFFHDLPFVVPGESPPPMFSVAINGDAAGSVLRIESAAQASVMDRTLTAFPYAIIDPKPRVLLLGEVGGSNVWLARRRSAEHVGVVQPNKGLLEILGRHSPALLTGADVSVHAVEPRRFLESIKISLPYDLIQISALEGLGIGGAGMRGLAEDHLATIEGFVACLRRLGQNGALAVCRGVQVPERENIRLFATLCEALESLGVENGAANMVQVRDYLGVCTIALRSPLSDAQREALRAALRAGNLTAVWYDGIQPHEVNTPDALPGPPGTSVDWLHHAAAEIVGDPDPARRHARREAFYAAWMLNVRPPRDDCPFFWDFFKPQAISELRKAFGDLWLTRAETGRLFLYASLALSAGAAVVLILFPLGVHRLLSRRTTDRVQAAVQSRGTALLALAYFMAIGLGFMGIEMVLISRATAALGDPVLASALVIAGVLLLSGLGSLTGVGALARAAWLAPLLVAIGAILVWLLAATSGPARNIAAAAAVLPLAYLMGTPMPVGLRGLDARAAWLVPWCWGVNGVGSVIATSAAIALAMEWGYRSVFLTATGCYVLASAALFVLERQIDGSPAQTDPT